MKAERAADDRDEGFSVRLGTQRVHALNEITVRLDMDEHGMRGEARVAAAELGGLPADYRSEARLQVGDQTLTAGWVVSATPDGGDVFIDVRNSVMLYENVIGQLSIAGIDPNEMAWSMAMWFGARPVVPGVKPFRETIALAMPVAGLDLGEEIDLDPVRITTDRQLIDIMAGPLNDSPEKEAFLAVGVWAVMRVDALLLWSADDAAIPVIEAAIDRLALEMQFSLATSPDGTALPWTRAAVFMDPRVVRTVLAHGHYSGRTWMRTVDNPRVREPASARRIQLPEVPTDPTWIDAVRAWRRAVREPDGLASVGAVFEAIEFYASATKLPAAVSAADLTAIDASINELALAEDTRKRISELLAMANQPPLLQRLLVALDADGVPYSQGEIDALWRLRKLRNKALHGAKRGAPERNDLEIAYAIVNRMLTFRGWKRPRVSERGDGPNSSNEPQSATDILSRVLDGRCRGFMMAAEWYLTDSRAFYSCRRGCGLPSSHWPRQAASARSAITSRTIEPSRPSSSTRLTKVASSKWLGSAPVLEFRSSTSFPANAHRRC
jgi:hypothetical protein